MMSIFSVHTERHRRGRIATAAVAATITCLSLSNLVAPEANAQARDAKGRYLPQGTPSKPPIPFDPTGGESAVKPTKIQTILIIGSDARPNEVFTKTRGDALHLIVWNADQQYGTMLNIPRDTMAAIPGRAGRTKINAALSTGGPELLTRTVANLTGIPVTSYVITGFAGFKKMIDDLGGFSIELPTLNDAASGAQFAGGWYNVNGDAALAFARDRHDVAGGDLGRTKNQGSILLANLAKLRSETSVVTDVVHWIDVFNRSGKTNLTTAQFLGFALQARDIRPERIANFVAPAHATTIGKASVVVLDGNAPTIFSLIKNTGWPTTTPPPPLPKSA